VVAAAQHGDLVPEQQDLDVLAASDRMSSASQDSTRVRIRYESRRATASDLGGRLASRDCEAGWRRKR
jgi:hypothetical protein